MKAFTDDALFIGQSAEFLELSMQLTIAADSVQRGFYLLCALPCSAGGRCNQLTVTALALFPLAALSACAHRPT